MTVLSGILGVRHRCTRAYRAMPKYAMRGVPADGKLFWGFDLLLDLSNRSGADDAHPFQDHKEHAARDERDNCYQHDSSHVFRSGSNAKIPGSDCTGPRNDVSRSLAS